MRQIACISAISFVFTTFLGYPGVASAQIAPGVLQSAAHTATVSGTVTGNDGAPVADADVNLTGTAYLSTKSDAHGTFSFVSVPYGTYQISVTSGLGATSQSRVVVSGDMNVSIQYAATATSGPKIIAHVVTHNAGLPINVTAASIASISPSDYAFQGNTSWTTLLNRIPGVTVSGYLTGATGGPGKYSLEYGSVISPQVISINGALPYETSTTLDGMPMENSLAASSESPGNGFDLGQLPMSLFETADVVRGPGANAPSIVDSIGGSLVLHSPLRVEKNQFIMSFSNDPWGGLVANAKIARRMGHLSVVLTYSVNNSPGPFGSTSVIQGNSANPTTVNGMPFRGCSATAAGGCSAVAACPMLQTQPTGCGYNSNLLYCCVPNTTAQMQHSGGLSLMYDITSKLTAQISYIGSTAINDLECGYHLIHFNPPAGYTGAIPAGASWEITASPSGQNQINSMLEEKLTDYIGKGVLRLAALQGIGIGYSSYLYPTNEPNGTYTLYGVGYFTAAPTTPVIFNGQQATLTFASTTPTYTFDFTHNRDLLASYTTSIGSNGHAGVSWNHSSYNLAGTALTTGFPVYNIQSGNTSTVQEIRLNAGTDVSNKLSLDGSYYIVQTSYHTENPFPGVGSLVPSQPWYDEAYTYAAPRLGATWRLNSNMVLRGAAGGGYAVAPLGKMVGSTLASLAPTCSGNTCSGTLSNLNIQPEKSFGFDIGTDMRLRQDTTLSFDIYHTNLYGQFFTSAVGSPSPYSGPGCLTPPCSLFIYQLKNLQQTRYEGLNISVDHEPAQGFFWYGGLGLMRGYVVSLPAGFYNSATTTCNLTTGANCINLYILLNQNFNGAAGGLAATPYANGSATIGYRWSAGKYVDLEPTYYGNGNSYFEPPFMAFNANLSYPLGNHVTLFAAFRNITNIYGQTLAQLASPTLIAPTAGSSPPYGLWGLPFGPRAVIVTAQFR